MKLTLTEPKLLKDPIAIISELVNEVTIKLDPDKIDIIAMDPANVAMIIFKLLSSSFVEYTVEQPTNMSLSLDNLNQILKRAKPSDTLILELDEENNKLKIQLKGSTTRTFHISLIDLEDSEREVPDLEFPIKVEIPTSVFDEAVEDMSVISEAILLTAEPSKFIIQAESATNSAKVEIDKDSDTNITMTKEDKLTAKYSVEYLKKIIKGSKLTDTLTLQFNQDYPLKTEYKLLDKLSFTVILAPRVSTD